MYSIYLIPLLIAMFLAVNMGGSGTAPSFSASYGANLIRKSLIPGLFGLFVFAGALLAGKKVVATIGKGIIPSESITLVLTSIILLSVALSLFFANMLKVPQSTSQSTVTALVGPAIYFDVLKSDKLFFEILPTWFITPIAAFLITFLVAKYIYRPLKSFSNISFEALAQHKIFKMIVILGGCYVAFAIGSNNVANASGPLVAMSQNILGVADSTSEFMLIMIILTLVIAPCFGIGSSFLGDRVLSTTGKEIISFGPLGATLISIVTASLLLLASLTKGIPTSLVQMNTGAIIGLGISKVGVKEIFKDTPLKKILTIWIIAPIISLVLSLLLTIIADKLGYL
ncbi:MAG: inorganic phosphate transporter family protein [Melioribacteraceae bacterium]|nr:inorganic phosphate transporter family protein [Melioribacteraceae bacterium]